MIKHKKLKMMTQFFKLKSIDFSEIDFDELLSILKQKKHLTKTFKQSVIKLINEKKATLKQNVEWYMSTTFYTSMVIAAIPGIAAPWFRNRDVAL